MESEFFFSIKNNFVFLGYHKPVFVVVVVLFFFTLPLIPFVDRIRRKLMK